MVVTLDLGEFLCYVHPVMVRHFDVTALDHDVHVTSLDRMAFYPDPADPGGIPAASTGWYGYASFHAGSGGWHPSYPRHGNANSSSPTSHPRLSWRTREFHSSVTKG
ncbi:hypothetical protein Misp04_16440 [Micromonospora sp. NBRC 101691]|nr:hypothetical protein Misp04_16440 [Micromonospora sp. NBRC 101691]